MPNNNDGYEVWSDVISAHSSEENAASWQYFWNFQAPLSDKEFDLLKELCYSAKISPSEHDVLSKLVNREMTLRIKSKCQIGQEAVAV